MPCNVRSAEFKAYDRQLQNFAAIASILGNGAKRYVFTVFLLRYVINGNIVTHVIQSCKAPSPVAYIF